MNKITVLLILILSVGLVYLGFSNFYTDRNLPASSLVPTVFIPPNEDRRPERTITPDASLNLTETTIPADNSPKAFSDRIKTIPGYKQNDPAYGGLPGPQDGDPGSMYCAPAAVSNSLMWLDDQGFENIVFVMEACDLGRRRVFLVRYLEDDPRPMRYLDGPVYGAGTVLGQ